MNNNNIMEVIRKLQGHQQGLTLSGILQGYKGDI
jgi:hypothetical protein